MRNGEVEGFGDYRWHLAECLFVTRSGTPVWRLDTVEITDGVMRLEGLQLDIPLNEPCVLSEVQENQAPLTRMPTAHPAPRGSMTEGIRLVILDLDDTLWKGTLNEGEIKIISAHIDIVVELTKRGIVNSVCSKNDFGNAKSVLDMIGLWRYFVFPQIQFSPKGAMVGRIIESAQLRESSVLF